MGGERQVLIAERALQTVKRPSGERIDPETGEITVVATRVKRREPEKRYLTAEQKRAGRRAKELNRVYFHQFPDGLPANELGVKYARYMCRTRAFFASPMELQRWLDSNAPWMDAETRTRILELGPHWYSKRSLGEHLELYDEER